MKTAKKILDKPKTSKVSTIVFLATIFIVLLSLTTVLFPSLLVRSTSSFKDLVINPFEPGVWTYPLVATNLILLAVGIAYKKDKLPYILIKSIKFVFNFEVSKKIALLVMIVFLAVYVGFTATDIAHEEIWEDYKLVKQRVQNWTPNDITQNLSEPHLRYLYLSISLDVFGNIRLLPFIVSLSLVILTYFITKELSQKRFAGLVAVAILLQSPVFLTYDTSATYGNLWTVLYILSLYLVYKKWPISPVTFIASISAKALTAMFLPMTLFFVYRSNLPIPKKKILLGIYGTLFVVGIIIVVLGIKVIGASTGYDGGEFWYGFTAWAFQMRSDVIVLFFVLPLIVSLYILSRRGIIQADSLMVLIMGMLLSAPVLQGFSDQTVQPYRFVPLVVFFAMGVGTVLTKRPNVKV